MRYSSHAEAEMAFDRFMDFADQKAAALSVFSNFDGSVDAVITSKATASVPSFDDDLDYPSYCKGTKHCHCVDCF